MLELNDPLWNKLGEHIPTMLSGLAASWDDETARSLLFDDLCHQEGYYGATYAAIPHLLRIAEPEENRRQRWEIALFVGFVALCAHNQGPTYARASFRGCPKRSRAGLESTRSSTGPASR